MIGASYSGSVVYLVSSDPDGFAITVSKRSTATNVSCQSPRVINQPGSCTATVDDTDAGTRSIPPGTVTFSRSGTGAGGFDTTSCALNPIPGDSDSSRCTVTYTPTSGAGTHTVRGDYGGSSLHKTSYGTFGITVNKRPTKLVYSGDTSGDYSDVVTLRAKLTDETDPSSPVALSGRTITFTIGSQSATASTDALGVASTTLTLTQKATATYTVDSSYAGDATYTSASDSDPFTINREKATIEYTGDTLKSTGSTASNSTATLSLSALVREEADGSLGDKLGEQKLTFTVYGSTDTTMSSPKFTCSANITPSATPGQGTAGCTTTQLAADNYIVKIVMGDKVANVGYYQAPVEDPTVTITIAGTGFTTCGGWLNETSLGSRSNFGFTVKYLKNANVQGNSLYIYRRTLAANTVANPAGGYLPAGAYNWIIKSNAMAGLTQTCSSTTPKVCTASFEGKNNITAVNRTTGLAYSLGGNYNFHVDVTDNSEPGSSPGAGPDTYTIRVWDASTGDYYKLPGFPIQTKIDGGNVQVRP